MLLAVDTLYPNTTPSGHRFLHSVMPPCASTPHPHKNMTLLTQSWCDIFLGLFIICSHQDNFPPYNPLAGCLQGFQKH